MLIVTFVGFINYNTNMKHCFLSLNSKDMLRKFLIKPSNSSNRMGGGEYIKFTSILHAHGIHHRYSAPHAPAQNDIFER